MGLLGLRGVAKAQFAAFPSMLQKKHWFYDSPAAIWTRPRRSRELRGRMRTRPNHHEYLRSRFKYQSKLQEVARNLPLSPGRVRDGKNGWLQGIYAIAGDFRPDCISFSIHKHFAHNNFANLWVGEATF